MSHPNSPSQSPVVQVSGIPDGEPVFVLRATDPATESTVHAYAEKAGKLGLGPAEVAQLHDLAHEMGEYARAHTPIGSGLVAPFAPFVR